MGELIGQSMTGCGSPSGLQLPDCHEGRSWPLRPAGVQPWCVSVKLLLLQIGPLELDLWTGIILPAKRPSCPNTLPCILFDPVLIWLCDLLQDAPHVCHLQTSILHESASIRTWPALPLSDCVLVEERDERGLW
jgi:hypothetical protein